MKLDSNDQRWDDSLLSKEEADAVFLSRKEAVIRRERVKEYLFAHRVSNYSTNNEHFLNKHFRSFASSIQISDIPPFYRDLQNQKERKYEEDGDTG